jgi:hypothetical protein
MEHETLLDAIEPKVVDALNEQADDLAHGREPNEYVRAAMALGSVPLMLGALATMAPAQTASSAVVDVLNYALLLENLENQFYLGVIGAAGSPFATRFATVRGKFAASNTTILPTLQLLSQHESAHVNFLTTVIKGLGGTPGTYDPASTFDFTGARTPGGSTSGPLYQATQDVRFLLLLTQGFEDTGVRAYKGQAGKLIGQQVPLTAALQIHALEARHAARIRRLRRLVDTSGPRLSGTVSGAGVPAASVGGTTIPSGAASAVSSLFAAIYAGEDNTIHTVNNGTADVQINAATLPNLQAGTDVSRGFDEPLGAVAVTAIAQGVVIPTLPAPSSNLAQ